MEWAKHDEERYNQAYTGIGDYLKLLVTSFMATINFLLGVSVTALTSIDIGLGVAIVAWSSRVSGRNPSLTR